MNLLRIACVCLLLAGCGIKGDLTRPSDIHQKKKDGAPPTNGLFSLS